MLRPAAILRAASGAALLLSACATPLSSMAPARTLGRHDAAVGWTAGLSLPTSGLETPQQGDGPEAAAATALAAAGFAQTLGIRWGALDGLELGARYGIGQLALESRIALLRPDDGLDLTLGVGALGAMIPPSTGRDALEIDSFVRAGGTLALVAGRTWSDFLSLWVAARGEVDGYDLNATISGADASASGAVTWVGGSVGLRVGLRRFFVGMELTAAYLTIGTKDETLAGLVLFPAFGVSIESR